MLVQSRAARARPIHHATVWGFTYGQTAPRKLFWRGGMVDIGYWDVGIGSLTLSEPEFSTQGPADFERMQGPIRGL